MVIYLRKKKERAIQKANCKRIIVLLVKPVQRNRRNGGAVG